MARKAWDIFTRDSNQGEPIEMWNAWLDYWCWIAEFADGAIVEIARQELWEPGSTEMQRTRSGLIQRNPPNS